MVTFALRATIAPFAGLVIDTVGGRITQSGDSKLRREVRDFAMIIFQKFPFAIIEVFSVQALCSRVFVVVVVRPFL